MALGWDFFGIPYPHTGIVDGHFSFLLDQKEISRFYFRVLGISYPREFLGEFLGIFRGWGFFLLDGISHQKATSVHR